MKKRILSGLNVLLLLLLLFLFNIPGCSLIRRPSPPRSPYARAMEKLRNGNPAAAASLLAFVNPDEEIYPAALIRGLEAAYNRDETLYVQFLSRLAEVLPRYPFLDDYYYYALMRQQAARGEHEYLLAYREFFELVGEEDLYKELLYYHVESLMKAGREDEALKEAASLYRRRLPKEHRAALEQLIISLLQKDAAPLQGPEWALLSSLPLRSSWVKRYLTTHFEDSRFWWETASRFLSIREMQAMGEGMNGYILARLFDRARATTETRHLISNHLDDPALKYPSPLAALFLTLFPDDLRNFAFFTMLDEEAAGATANHLFKSLLEMRRYDILKKWLSVWSREKGAMSAETRARFLYWEALLGMENKKLTPRGKLALIECCRLAPLSYYHIKAARLLHLSPLDSRLFSARIKRGRPNQKMKSLLKSLDAYSDIEGIRLIQLSIDNDCFHDNLPLFMNLYLRYRDFDWMILSTRYLWKTEGPSKDLLPYLYPRGFKKEIRLHSALPAEQDPLVYAVIHQESRFSPTAVSRAGARGLMQLMPSTFTDLIRTAAETGKEESIFDIDDNITAGTAYLKRLFHRFSQSEYVLAAYNAGPHRLHLWKDEFGHRSPDEFVELIPFAETRYYVSRVIALEEIYRAMGP